MTDMIINNPASYEVWYVIQFFNASSIHYELSEVYGPTVKCEVRQSTNVTMVIQMFMLKRGVEVLVFKHLMLLNKSL